MASYYRAPDPLQSTQLVPGGNTPASAALLFTYVAGSSTKQTVYKDNAGNASWTNPIVLDSGGNLPSNGTIWIPAGVTIDAVLAPSTDADPPSSPYWTKEDISGINDIAGSVTEWVSGPAPTFVNSTSFVLAGDQTSTFKNARRVRTTNTGGTIYSRITSAVASAGSTTVNVVNDSGGLDSGLSATAYGLLDPQFTSITEYHVNKDGGSVASAGNGTTNIWGVPGNSVHITGTNTIASFSSASYAGAQRTVVFDGALTIATSAAFLSAPSGPLRNLVTQAGDRAQLVASTTPHVVIAQYERASGRAITESCEFLASTVAASSATVDLVFSSAAVSSFSAYMLTISSLVPQTDGVGVYMRVSEDGGANFNASSTAYRWGAMRISDSNNTVSGATSNALGQIDLTAADVLGNGTGENLGAKITLFDPSNTNLHKRFLYQVASVNSSGVNSIFHGHGTYASTAAINAVRFLASSGNINAGKFAIYGMRTIP